MEWVEIIKEFGITVTVVVFFMYKDISLNNKIKDSIDNGNKLMSVLIDRNDIKGV